MAAWKRMVQLGAHSRLCLTNIKGFSNYSSSSSVVDSFGYRRISQLVKPNGKRAFLVDTLAQVSSQEAQGVLSKQAEEKLKSEIEKMRSELRYENDKVIAGQLLDLNLKKGRISDELANLNAEIKKISNKFDREIHALGAQLEAAEYDVIKYCIGTVVSISAVGLAIILYNVQNL